MHRYDWHLLQVNNIILTYLYDIVFIATRTHTHTQAPIQKVNFEAISSSFALTSRDSFETSGGDGGIEISFCTFYVMKQSENPHVE